MQSFTGHPSDGSPRGIELRAYNLVAGAAFTGPPSAEGVWVVIDVLERNHVTEKVLITIRRADIERESFREIPDIETITVDFNDQVTLVGLVVNERDLDDNDWGSELTDYTAP